MMWGWAFDGVRCVVQDVTMSLAGHSIEDKNKAGGDPEDKEEDEFAKGPLSVLTHSVKNNSQARPPHHHLRSFNEGDGWSLCFGVLCTYTLWSLPL